MDSTSISGSASKFKTFESIAVFKQTEKHRSMVEGSIHIYMCVYIDECLGPKTGITFIYLEP